MVFYEGAVSYVDIKHMPLYEYQKLQKVANQIQREREAEIERAKRGK